MDRIKTRLIIAVTNRLRIRKSIAAEDTNAKADLIEELSENLYQRYLDLIGSGVSEEDAYRQALDDLGDVDELLEYLRSLGPDGELPRQQEEGQGRDYLNEFLRGAEEVVRETISQTKDAVGQAKVIVRDVTEKLREKYPNGFEGNVHVHFVKDDDGHGEHPQGWARRPRSALRTGDPGLELCRGLQQGPGAASSLKRARAARWRAPPSPPIR